MRKYEIMYIVKTNLEEKDIKSLNESLQEIFKLDDSKIVEFKELGQKKLAYPIKKEVNGLYFLLTVEANNQAVNEFKHKISINENVLRHLIVKLDEE